MPLRAKATAEEARTVAGLNRCEWHSFYRITKDEARRVIEKHPGLTWCQTPAWVKNEVWDRVNAQLAEEQALPVGFDVIMWRMNTAVRDARNWARRCAAKTLIDLLETGQRCRPLPFDPMRDQQPGSGGPNAP
ncbi:hypothetical protein M011DRAFT_465549 [Sporormia fimetaria CBS 119925]|uniref:Uncharacterized protein n=1 Tax=Sporormia fimetaria CBS 119925 TaxID=1340428 RepID=A0A6A6VL06_9PLEO|nr:hypothetical protein M011DRAFT_465549 [Sporormia fimetaria CBS 119925]